jgi:hybrid polyketide synthase/nonribosomal peptide synthetase ACE1
MLTNVDAFIAKLNSSLNLSSDDSIDGNTPLIDLGLDSLVAVDIRTWFLQELKIDLPVLKILGGASAVELVSLAVEKLPQEILPNFGEGSKHDSIPAPEESPPPAALSLAQPPKLGPTGRPPSNDNAVPAPPKPSPSSATSTLSYKSSPPPSFSSTTDDEPPTPPSEPENKVSEDKSVDIQDGTR